MGRKTWEEMEPWEQGDRLSGMAASIRIKGAQHHAEIDAVLCAKCEYGMVYRQRTGNGGLRVLCSFGRGQSVPPDIAECSRYDPKAGVTVSLEDMAKVALTIDTRALPPSLNTYL